MMYIDWGYFRNEVKIVKGIFFIHSGITVEYTCIYERIYNIPVIAGGFPTVALDRGASSFAKALHIRERYAKYPNPFGLCSASS